MFHLDEYVGLPESHAASFRKYLKERFISKVNLKACHLVEGRKEQLEELSRLLCEKPIDLGLIGIGENGHIAFNDPPADFEEERAYKIVQLDQRCRQQQVNEGWFATINDVPKEAMTMSDRIFLMNKGQFVQMGTPEEVYLSPATEFAARFIGSYNLLTKEQAAAIFDVGSEELYAVRPESVYVQEEGGIYPSTCSSPVQGTVVSHQLLGNVIRYRIEALGAELTVDVMNRSSSRLYAPQTSVKLLFNRAEIKPLAR